MRADYDGEVHYEGGLVHYLALMACEYGQKFSFFISGDKEVD